VRTRKATDAEIAQAESTAARPEFSSYPQRDAVLFALMNLKSAARP
jgi:hypothetical protein